MTQERETFESQVRNEIREFEGCTPIFNQLKTVCEFIFEHIDQKITLVDAVFLTENLSNVVNFISYFEEEE